MSSEIERLQRLLANAEQQLSVSEEEKKQEVELRMQAEERERQAEQRERQEKERNRPTTLAEFIQYCYDLLWQPLRVVAPSRSTTGTIPPPIGKYCPIRLRHWTDCARI